MSLIRNVTLYDLRMLYLLRRDNTDESLCVSLGLLEIMDNLERDEDRTCVVESTLKIFSSLTYLVNNAPRADKEYFNNDGIDSTTRRSRLKHAGQLRKSIEHTLSHLGWFDNIAVLYFLDHLIKSPKKYNFEVLLADLYQLSGDSSASGYVPSNTSSLLTTLDAKRSEFKRINELSARLESATKDEANSVSDEITRKIDELDIAIQTATESMEKNVINSITSIQTKLELEVEPLLRKIGTLQAQIDMSESKLISLQEMIGSSLTRLSERSKLDPKTSLVNMLTEVELSVSRLNNQNDQDTEMATATLQLVLNRLKNLRTQISSTAINDSIDGKSKSTLFEMAMELSKLTEDIKLNTTITKEASTELSELSKLIHIIKTETSVYKHNALHNKNIVDNIKEKLYV